MAEGRDSTIQFGRKDEAQMAELEETVKDMMTGMKVERQRRKELEDELSDTQIPSIMDEEIREFTG